MLTKNWKGLAVLCALTLSLTAVQAQAEIIGGTSYIQPVSVVTDRTNPLPGGGYTGAEGTLIDGSGIDTATGFAGNPTQAATDGFGANGNGYLLFDLGSQNLLTGTRIWNRNFGPSRIDNNAGAFGSLVPFTAYLTGVGGWHNMSEVSTSNSSSLIGSGGTVAFATPVESFGTLHSAAPLAQSTTYAGETFSLAATLPAQYVLFRFNTVGDLGGEGGSLSGRNGFYTDRNETSWWSMNEVRFQTAAAEAIPEPSTLVLAGIGLLGLVACGRRRNRRRA